MSGRIIFTGAGPGAADLITVRGWNALKQADAVIYAGSLVDEKLLENAPGAILHNSAKMTLDEVMTLLEQYWRGGKTVVRLHTGDPAMYGAVGEQYRELDRRGIPYEVIPGVSSVFAAAAALKTELTMPDVSQTVILTREAGRTPVPDRESLDKLAALGTTLCIFLSVADLTPLCRKLIAAGRAPETAAAVVYRASWENQKIVRGTLADLAEKVGEAGIKRQAMIVVGNVLNRDGALSKLYDSKFATGYRGHDFSGKTALFALTRNAVLKASEIAAGLENAKLFVPEKFRASAPGLRTESFPDGQFGTVFTEQWKNFDGFVLVMAAGIAVRHLAKLCSDKKTDPAAVVCDERGNYAVSLLSGHLGGANDLARAVARITGGKPVVTTASDVENLPALDDFARRFHYRILDPLTFAAAEILEGRPVEAEMPEPLFRREFSAFPQFTLKSDRTDGMVVFSVGGRCVRMEKRVFVLGIGCRKGVPESRISEVVRKTLAANGLTLDEVDAVCSAEAKANETGLLSFARNNRKKIEFRSREELNSVPVPNPSATAEKFLEIHSVSEAAALLGAGENAKLTVEKNADGDVTVAVAERRTHE